MGGEDDKAGKELLHHDPAVVEVHEQAKRDHVRDHNHTVAQSDTDSTALSNGRRALAHKNPFESLAARKKKEQDRARMRTALKQLLDRLQDLFEEIAAIDERLQEIDTEISELEYLKELAENGLLDPTNSDHAILFKKYGITQEDIESGKLSTILADKLGQRFVERTELQKRKESLQQQAHEAIDEAQAGGVITLEEAQHFHEQLKSLEAGVSSQVRIMSDVSEDLREIAVNHFTDLIDEISQRVRFNYTQGTGACSRLPHLWIERRKHLNIRSKNNLPILRVHHKTHRQLNKAFLPTPYLGSEKHRDATKLMTRILSEQ